MKRTMCTRFTPTVILKKTCLILSCSTASEEQLLPLSEPSSTWKSITKCTPWIPLASACHQSATIHKNSPKKRPETILLTLSKNGERQWVLRHSLCWDTVLVGILRLITVRSTLGMWGGWYCFRLQELQRRRKRKLTLSLRGENRIHLGRGCSCVWLKKFMGGMWGLQGSWDLSFWVTSSSKRSPVAVWALKTHKNKPGQNTSKPSPRNKPQAKPASINSSNGP